MKQWGLEAPALKGTQFCSVPMEWERCMCSLFSGKYAYWVDLNFWQQYVLLHGVCSPLVAEAYAWSIVNLMFPMGLQSKVLTCKKCQFSNREVLSQSKSCLKHFGTIHAGCPVQHLSSFPFHTAAGHSKAKGRWEQIFKCSSATCHLDVRRGLCKIWLCFVSYKAACIPSSRV